MHTVTHGLHGLISHPRPSVITTEASCVQLLQELLLATCAIARWRERERVVGHQQGRKCTCVQVCPASATRTVVVKVCHSKMRRERVVGHQQGRAGACVQVCPVSATRTVVVNVGHNKMQREREWLVTSRVGQVLAFRNALLQQVHQNRPCFCLHSPPHELRASQVADIHQALHCCLNQGWPLVLHPAKCTCRQIKQTEGSRVEASCCLDGMTGFEAWWEEGAVIYGDKRTSVSGSQLLDVGIVVVTYPERSDKWTPHCMDTGQQLGGVRRGWPDLFLFTGNRGDHLLIQVQGSCCGMQGLESHQPYF